MNNDELTARLALAGLPVDFVTLPRVDLDMVEDEDEAIFALLKRTGLVEPSVSLIARPTENFAFVVMYDAGWLDFPESGLVYGVQGAADWRYEDLPHDLLGKPK